MTGRELSTQYRLGTPTQRLAALIVEALDGDDLDMARTAALRLLDLGEKQ